LPIPATFSQGISGRRAFDVFRQMAAGLGDDLHPALNEPMPLPIGFQVVNRQVAQHLADTRGRVDYVVKP
jgi:hypothetical protein